MSTLNRKGFTLVEAMIVLVVIGVIVIIATPAFLDANKKAQNSAKHQFINAVERAKMQLTLPVGSITGAMGADTNTLISSGAGYTNLLAILKIDPEDMPKALAVGSEEMILGDMNGSEGQLRN